jgi:valyl-tRNA synthetase
VTLKELMRSVVESGEIKITPDRFEKTYFHWINNLRDWCISRQIWYGHRIPVWYKDKEIYLTKEEALYKAKRKTLQSKEKYVKEMLNSFYELLDEWEELNLEQDNETPFTISKLNGYMIFKDNIREDWNSIYNP